MHNRFKKYEIQQFWDALQAQGCGVLNFDRITADETDDAFQKICGNDYGRGFQKMRNRNIEALQK
jgi:hypothetical protein